MQIDTKSLLLIFTRNPELGKCKTRLAATIGDEAALDIYIFLLEHTAKITQQLNTVKEVYYSESIGKKDVWNAGVYSKNIQEGKDLGERMRNAFKAGFDRGFQRIIIIGSDLYDLRQEDLESAFNGLKDHNYVLGPAQDGGYYLLGMNEFNEDVFQNKNWGTNTVLNSTLDDLKGKKLKLLQTRNDIDVYEDVKDIEVFEPFLKHSKK